MAYFTKTGVSYSEYKIQKYVSELPNIKAPKAYDYDHETKTICMQKIHGMSVADFYGEDASNVPTWVFDEIRFIIKTLYMNGIEYPDITGYNFMLCNDKIYIIDFGHARAKKLIKNRFVHKFINGYNGWNPAFA
jgi:tRNA A-37 threonylcarbamoyl transferase component Bud32